MTTLAQNAAPPHLTKHGVPDQPHDANEEPPSYRGVGRVLHLFTDIKPGEAGPALALLLNLFVIFVAYYIIKTVREPLILEFGGAEWKTYAAAAQALTLMAFIPIYGWFAARVHRLRLVLGSTFFFALNLELFHVATGIGVPYLGIIFYIWVGVFSLVVVAQFWSFANDLYERTDGERLFPMIAIGGTLGAPVGSKIAARLFHLGLSPALMMETASGLLLFSALITSAVHYKLHHRASSDHRKPLTGRGGFSMIIENRYFRLIALVVLFLNLVNTTGEYILAETVLNHANLLLANADDATRRAFIGAFYGNFYFYVNIATLVIQAFLVSRVMRWTGIAGLVLILPIVAFGVYGLVAMGGGFLFIRWAKTAENAVDYSLMSTGRAVFWLPTDVDAKYKAKQAVDTVFVRFGDVIAASLVFFGTNLVPLGIRSFALANLFFIAVWFVLAFMLLKEYRALSRPQPLEPLR